MDVILGTAGHIDHGKTSLVSALTGIDCDRLEEEKRRGITIELGFAWMDLPAGNRLGIIDVPGHERFIKNMTAGASGIDFVLLVVAADEGVMPQTREHLEICSLLGVKSGLIALTKTDLVDEEMLALAREDVKNAISDTFLKNAPILPVSARTGAGLDDLREAIIKISLSVASKEDAGIFRLPVDRVFAMKGYGTIVTGTIASGFCCSGEKLCVMPKNHPVRARNIQVHNLPVENAHAGQRCAINLQGVETSEIGRGDVIAKTHTLFLSANWYVRLHCLKSSPMPIRQRVEVHLHHKTSATLAKIIFPECDSLNPGQTALAEIRFEKPFTAVYGDHFILRARSPLQTIGGGIVICPMPPLLKKRSKDYARQTAILNELFRKADPDNSQKISPESFVKNVLGLYPAPGVNFQKLQVLTNLNEKVLAAALKSQESNAFCWDQTENFWVDKAIVDACIENCRQRILELHKKEPLKSSFAAQALFAGWGENLPEKFSQAIITQAVKKGILSQTGAGLKLAEHKVTLDKESAKILETLSRKIRSGGAAPPFIRELLEEYKWDMKKVLPVLAHLCETGEFVKLQEGVYYDARQFSIIKNAILEWFKNNEEMDLADVKNILGLSRKYLIPILEYLDAIKLTYRVENRRRLRKN